MLSILGNTMKEKVFVVLIAVFLLASFAPTFYEIAHRDRLHSIREFELVHNFPTDFNFYLSRIRQGMEGRLTVVERYTSEKHQGSFLQEFYLLLGWTGRVLHIPPRESAYVYHVARFVFGFFLLYILGKVIQQIIAGRTWQIITFLLVVTASSWPRITYEQGQWYLTGFMRWWSLVDPLIRISFIPHLLVGQTLILLLLVKATDPTIIQRPRAWLVFGLLAFLLGVIFPPGLLFVIVGLIVHSCIEAVFLQNGQRERQGWITIILGRIILVALSLPALVYVQLIVSFYPWKRLVEFDAIHPTAYLFIEYIKSVGPILPLGLLGIIFAFVRKRTELFVFASWVITWLLMLEVFRHTSQTSPLRLTQMVPQIPLGILSGFFFYELTIFVKKSHHTMSKLTSLVILLMPFVLITYGFVMMYQSFLSQKDFIDHKMRADLPLVPSGTYVMYPLKDFVSALSFLETETPQNAVVLSDTTVGNYIPVYSGRIVYIGHDNTVFYEEKVDLARYFYSGRMNNEQARQWFTNSRISYVVFGPQEREQGLGDLQERYPFLIRLYENSFFQIFRVE